MLKHDKDGFLQGTPVAVERGSFDRAIAVWQSIKRDTKAIRNAVGANGSAAVPGNRPVFSDRQIKHVADKIASAAKVVAQAQVPVNGRERVSRRKSAPTAIPGQPAAIPEQTAPGLPPPQNRNLPNNMKERQSLPERGKNGRFTKGGGSGGGSDESSRNEAVARAIKDGFDAAGQNIEDLDPVIKASKETKEIADNALGFVKGTANIFRGIWKLGRSGFGIGRAILTIITGRGDKELPWLKRIFKELKKQNERPAPGSGGIGGGFGLGGFAGAMGGLVERFGATIMPMLASIAGAALKIGAVAMAYQAGKAVGDWIYEKFGPQIVSAIESTVGFFKDSWGKVVDAASSGIEFVADKGEKAKDAVVGGYQGAVNAVSGAIETIAGAASNVWDKIRGKKAVRRDALMNQMAASGITDPKEQAMFLAQMSHESGGFGSYEESFKYKSPQAIMGVSKQASSAGINAVRAAMASGPQSVAELMYGGRMGNVMPGDAYNFRGRGAIQLTGRDNYAAAGKALGVDLLKNPELASDPKVAAQIATWYWKKNGVGAAAMNGDVTAVTEKINGGRNGLADRQAQYAGYLSAIRSGSLATNTPITMGMPTASSAAIPAEMARILGMPSVITPVGQRSGAGTVLRLDAPVGQNVSDRSIAQVATGGIGAK